MSDIGWPKLCPELKGPETRVDTEEALSAAAHGEAGGQVCPGACGRAGAVSPGAPLVLLAWTLRELCRQ